MQVQANPASALAEQQLEWETDMPYEAAIQRSNPTVFLFVVDLSGSMADKMASSDKSKADFVADVLNRTLMNLIGRCGKPEGVRDYFHIGVIAYGGDYVGNGFQGVLGSQLLNPISVIANNPLRVEDRMQRISDGAGGLVEQPIKFPVWFESTASGGTPMIEALNMAAQEVATWCDANPSNYPPTILHITDGEPSKGDPTVIAEMMKGLQTADGNVLLLNLHVSSQLANPISFPAGDAALPDDYARQLFRMSSQLPSHLVEYAQSRGVSASFESRGFMFNADATGIVDFFDIGTRGSQLR